MNELVNIQPDLLRYAFSLTRNDSAYDLMQDTNVKIIEKYEQFKPGCNLRKWGFTVMYHLFVDWKRKEKHMQNVFEIKTVTYYDLDNFDLNKAIRNIRHFKTREAIILRLKFGLKVNQIAEVQGDNINAVKARVWDGRKQIHSQYEKN